MDQQSKRTITFSGIYPSEQRNLRCCVGELTPPGCLAVSSETIASASLWRDFFCVSRDKSSRRFSASRVGVMEGVEVTAAMVVVLLTASEQRFEERMPSKAIPVESTVNPFRFVFSDAGQTIRRTHLRTRLSTFSKFDGQKFLGNHCFVVVSAIISPLKGCVG